MRKDEFINLDPDEQIEFEVHRNPIASVPIYLTGLIIFTMLLGLVYLAATNTAEIAEFVPPLAVYFGISLLMLLDVGITFIAAAIFMNNYLVITNENLIQMLQMSLFSRKVSQLSLAKIQDVTAKQNGFFPTVFKYGSIGIESAGEQSNFTFRFAEKPYESAKRIIDAGDRYNSKHGLSKEF